jgi:hypothetical protein
MHSISRLVSIGIISFLAVTFLPCAQAVDNTVIASPAVVQPEPDTNNKPPLFEKLSVKQIGQTSIQSKLGIVVAQDCIDKGQACVINGTPCCGTTTCQGKFPNTTCQ